jgi:copper homeostasis protein
MIRPRGGDFTYSAEELEIMLADIALCRKLGSDGVVFGCLNEDWIDEEKTAVLIQASEGMSVTFHMAFDYLPVDRQFAAIDWLSQRGVERILTHGGPAENSIEENVGHLKDLIAYSKERIIILPGGKISHQNVQDVAETLGVKEAHGTEIVEF